MGLIGAIYAIRGPDVDLSSTTTRDTATEITAPGGEEVSGVDIRYRFERDYIISGKITGLPATGGPAQVILRKAGLELPVATTATRPGGVGNYYAFYGPPNGEYEVVAARDSSSDDDAFDSSPRRVVVNGRDVGGVDLALAPLAALAGKVTLEKAARKCQAARDSRLNEIGPSRPPVCGRFSSSFSFSPIHSSPSQMRARTSAEFSPIPPVNTTASASPIAASYAPIYL